MSRSEATTIAFDQEQPGTLPGGWHAGVTGQGAPLWMIRVDDNAPSTPNVLEQSGSGTFPWCVMPDRAIADGRVEVTIDDFTYAAAR